MAAAALAANDSYVSERANIEISESARKGYCFLVPEALVAALRLYVPNATFSKPDQNGIVKMVL